MENEITETEVKGTEVVAMEVKETETEEVNADKEIETKVISFDDIFISEDDTFDVTVAFYEEEGELIVHSIDNEYVDGHEAERSFTVTLKYPSQADLEAIMSTEGYVSPENMTMMDIIKLELTRIGVLIRSWTIDKEITEVGSLNPKIIKGLASAVREKIGMDGIV